MGTAQRLDRSQGLFRGLRLFRGLGLSRPWALALLLALASAGCQGRFLTAEEIDQRLDASTAGEFDSLGADGDTAGQADTLGVDGPTADAADAADSDSGGGDSGCQAASECNDQNPCTTDNCEPSGSCSHAPIANGGSCDDGNACTTGEYCSSGNCAAGVAKVCDDQNLCTADACLPAKGCTYTNDDGAPCNDDDPCSSGDKCLSGQCTGKPKDCGNDECTSAKCVGGTCKAASKPDDLDCDDSDACTSGDKCKDGLCVGAAKTDCNDQNPCTQESCVGTLGCKSTPLDGPCSDGDACSVADTCSAGACKAGQPKQCDDGNPCTQDKCDAVSGACAASPSDAACSDGNACTAGDACKNGSCQAGSVTGCDDKNPCTVDTCDASTGACQVLFNTAPCDDGDACSVGDSCASGTCQPGAEKPCADSNTCTSDSCNPQTGACVHAAISGCGDGCSKAGDCKAGDVCNEAACVSGKCAFLPTSAGCDDGDACTAGDQCEAGGCKPGSAKNCDDGQPCTADSCKAGACQHANSTDACSDNNACTQGDLCGGGVCKPGAAKVCDDANPCTQDGCDAASGSCSATPNSAVCSDGIPCTSGEACQGGSCVGGKAVACDDGNACTSDACDPKTGGCNHSNNSAPCSDGNACSEGDVCGGGSCQSGTAKTCGDGNPCTTDTCNPATAACSNSANAAPCSDGDACSVGDACSGGACKAGAAKVCADSDTCTNDACDPASGNCVFKPITGCGGNCAKAGDCSDSNVCTDDACVSGKCAFPANTASCSDNNACTLGDACSGGACKPGAAKGCNDGNPCTNDSCDPQSGACVQTPNTAVCDDGNACTAGDVCGSGACKAGKATDCSDGNPCTTDSCNPVSGACQTSANTAACSDGNACTLNDSCAGSVCKAGSAKSCDDANPCTNDSCDPLSGACAKVANSAPCSDGNACTQGDVCAATVCNAGPAKVCNDSNPCTSDGCDAASGNCTAVANTAACEDGSKCTSSDKCSGGSCQPGTAKVCDDGDSCTSDSCNPGDASCVFAPKIGCGGNCSVATDCSDANPCTDNQCVAGKCAFPNNTLSCDDKNPCTISDICAGGACKSGATKSCDDSNLCTNDSCTAASGLCSYVNNSNSCSDGDACTSPDACSAGKCQPGSKKSCQDGNACTDDSCNSTSGACVYTNNTAACNDNSACTSGDICANGSCAGPSAVTCNDNKPCTTDSCDPASGCKFLNNTQSCSDGNACTSGDLCSGGACVGGPAPVCNDDNLCTTDSCDAASGCKYTANTAQCDDGNKCTLGDVCKSATCTAGSAKVCSDGDNCTSDSCDPAGGSCVFKPIIGCGGNCAAYTDCNDGNVCTTDNCSAGKCVFSNHTLPCNDGDACTGGDICSDGKCAGTVDIACEDKNPCTDDSCDKSAGCIYSAVANGTLCEDGQPCTVGDNCLSGACKAGTAVWVDTFAGSVPANNKGYGSGSLADGSGSKAGFNTPMGMVYHPGDNKLYVADSASNAIRSLGLDGEAKTVAGDPAVASLQDGKGTQAKFNVPMGIAVDSSGVLYVADTLNHAIRTVLTDGTVTTLAGTGTPGAQNGKLSGATFSAPRGIAVNSAGLIAVADTNNHRIRIINLTTNGVTTLAGSSVGTNGGSGTAAQFNTPIGVAFGPGGALYVADQGNQRIRKVTPEGMVTTVAGDGSASWSDHSNPLLARFYNPTGLFAIPSGPLLIADSYNGRIRRLGPTGVGTVAGSGTGSADGAAATSSFYMPHAIAADSNGYIYVADSYNHVIRRIRDGSAPCTIGGECVVGGWSNPKDSCLHCDAATSPSSWSSKANGGLCDDGNLCTSGDICSDASAKGGCTGGGLDCDDANACTNDSCDAQSGGCLHAANGGGCNDGNTCTGGDYCSGGACIGGPYNGCDDSNPCTNDTCNLANNSCSNPPVSYGSACSPTNKAAYGFCAGSKCTGLEQSANLYAGSGSSANRLTSVTAGPDQKLYASGFGLAAAAGNPVSAIWTINASVSPPALTSPYTTAGEVWSLAKRLASGGSTSVGTAGDTNANVWTHGGSGWGTIGLPYLPNPTARILRQSSQVDVAGGSETYLLGGNPDGASAAPPTTLMRLGWSSASGWLSGNGYGEMAVYNSVPTTAAECLSKRVSVTVTGIAAFNSTSAYIASNFGVSNLIPQVGLFVALIGPSALCKDSAPGGALVYASGYNYLGLASGTVTGVAATAANRAIAVGSSAGAPWIQRRTETSTWAAETPTPTPPSGMPAWGGYYAPTAVWLGAKETWITGILVYNGCSYVFALHGSWPNSTVTWDKLLVTSDTVAACGSSAQSQLSVTKVWGDPASGAVYLTGSSPVDSIGKTKVGSGTASAGQVGVLWRIQ